MGIKENLDAIIDQKSRAAKAAGRRSEDILLCAVTKTRTPEEINEAILCGVTDIGENKVQEILDKFDKVLPVKWHLIGHLQTNKVKYIVDKVTLIHSVDSLNLAREIDKRCGEARVTMDILVQVNSAEEESKFGITTRETGRLIEEVLNTCPNIIVKGLMCIAPYADDSDDIRIYFREVKQLYDKYSKIDHPNLDFKYLSMGMSHDFEVAIDEGSNLIRIGTAIFGDRNYGNRI